MRGLYKLAVTATAAFGAISAMAAYTVSTFTTWGASDATLGVSGYTVEDFEDVNLVASLKVSVDSPNGNLALTNVLPNTFNPNNDPYGNTFLIGGGGVWDGENGIINTRTNQPFPYAEEG